MTKEKFELGKDVMEDPEWGFPPRPTRQSTEEELRDARLKEPPAVIKGGVRIPRGRKVQNVGGSGFSYVDDIRIK